MVGGGGWWVVVGALCSAGSVVVPRAVFFTVPEPFLPRVECVIAFPALPTPVVGCDLLFPFGGSSG